MSEVFNNDLFKILADDNRLRILVLLLDREICMTHIYIGLDLKQSNTSRNLKILKEHGIVSVRNKKNNRYFKIADDCFKKYNQIFEYLRLLGNEDIFKEDVARMKAVENCGCGAECECKI